MTINSTIRKAGPFIGNGTASSFPFTYKVFQASDLDVVRLDQSTNVETTLALTTDYTVVLNQDQDSNPGGTVTLVAGPLASGYTLTMTSDVPNLQPTDLTNQGGFYPEVINDALDRATIQIQQLQEQTDRSFKVAISSNVDATLPPPNPNDLIGWDATGEALVNVDPGSLATVVAYATAYCDVFVGNGITTSWTLTRNPAVLYNLDVSINGSTQEPTRDYTLSGTTFTMTTPPPIGARVVVKYKEGLPNYEGDSQDVRFLQAGTGATSRSVQSRLREVVSVKDFGAVGDGVINDTDAFAAASAYITSIGGGKLVIPPGTYVVGKQDFAGATGKGYAYRGRPIIKIENCTRPVVVESQGARLVLASGLKFGSFNPVTGAVYTPPSMPFVNYDYNAGIGTMVQFYNNANVTLTGGLELDGNIANVVLGGQWGDTGYQCVAYGVWAYDNDQCVIENVWCHHHALDGMASGYNGITTEAGVAKPMTLINCVFENNARQGWSVTGGRGITAINCKFNNTGKDIPFASSPGAGCDLEAEGGWIRDVLFLDCEFSNNIGAGLVADSGNTASVTSIRCKFIGTNNTPIWPRKPRITFNDCLIVGTAFNAYASDTQPDDATKFLNCKFSDEVAYSPTGIVYNDGFLANFEAGNGVLLENCNFTATTNRNLNIKGSFLVRNCTFVCKASLTNQDYVALMWNGTIENLTIIDQIASPAVDGYYVNLTNAKYKGTNYISGTKIKWWSWSGGAGGASGFLGQSNPNELAYPYLSVIKGSGAALLGYYGTADTYWGTAAPTTGTFKRGDRFFNSEPTVGQPKSWVCTVAGTPGTWVSEGNL